MKTRLIFISAAAIGAAALAGYRGETPREPLAASSANAGPALSCSPPTDDKAPASNVTNGEPFFDEFAWRSFVAMVCKAGADTPGAAVSFGGPHVFETYKAAWELFPSTTRFPVSGARPPNPKEWGQYGGADFNPCTTLPKPGELVLGSISKFSDIAQAGPNRDPLPPIVAQNSTYVHYVTQFNKVEFDYIRDNQLYLASHAGGGANFPAGSIAIKSAWLETTQLSEAAKFRYYRKPAWIESPVDKHSCKEQEVALIAMHIVQKTAARSQRIWASFEHEDNVPPVGPLPNSANDPPDGYRFFNRQGGAMPRVNPIPINDIKSNPAPFNIERKKPSTPNAGAVSINYAAALRGKLDDTTPWAHYRLVMAQWPTAPNCHDAGTPCAVQPGPNSPWAWANPVMETYFQEDKARGSCLACHSLTTKSPNTDFVWSLRIESYPDSSIDLRENALDTLGAIYRQAQQ